MRLKHVLKRLPFVIVITAAAAYFIWAETGVQSRNLALEGCEVDVSRPNLNVTEAEKASLINSINRFSMELFERTSQNHPNENIFLATFAVNRSLTMVYEGAKGETAEQMAEVMHIELPQGDLSRVYAGLTNEIISRSYPLGTDLHKITGVEFANIVWGQRDVAWDPAYLDVITDYYGCGFRSADFATDPTGEQQRVNDWVEEVTDGRIVDHIPDGIFTEDTALAATSVVSFLGNWQYAFPTNATEEQEFMLKDGSFVMVDMMAHDFEKRAEAMAFSTTEFRAIDLPYYAKDYGMLVIVPTNRDPSTIFGQFSAEDYAEAMDYIDEPDYAEFLEAYQVFMPKFEGKTDILLIEELMEMGMTIPMTGAADFSGMVAETPPRGNIFLDEVVHSSYIRVDESGTEARGAVTSVMIFASFDSEPVPCCTFRIDQPFIYVIHDRETGLILFIGQMMNPNA